MAYIVCMLPGMKINSFFSKTRKLFRSSFIPWVWVWIPYMAFKSLQVLALTPQAYLSRLLAGFPRPSCTEYLCWLKNPSLLSLAAPVHLRDDMKSVILPEVLATLPLNLVDVHLYFQFSVSFMPGIQ